MITWESVVAIARTMPAVEESTSWGTPSLKVGDKMIARLRSDSDGALALKCTAQEKAALLASADPAFYTSAHYDGYNYILINLQLVDAQELEELIVEAWRIAAPARLRKEFDA